MKTRERKFILFVVLYLLVGLRPAGADFNEDAKGTTTANFLKLGVGARAEAMGEAFSAVVDDATALYWNPAALTRIHEKSSTATLMHAPYVESSFFDYLAYAKRSDESSAWGTSVQYFSAGSITQTDVDGFEQGSFTPYDLAASIGYAYQFKYLSLGATVKYIRSVILATAQTAAMDVGVLSSPLLNNKLRLAGTVSHLGGKMKFEQESSRLPLTYRFGASFQATQRWLASADVVMPIDNAPYAALGTEYRWPLSRTWDLAARAGINSLNSRDLDGLSGISMGIGMNFETVSVDYALEPLGDLGLTHRISVSFRFLPISAVLPNKQTNLHAPNYPDYNDVQPYFDDLPSLRDTLE